MSLLSIQQAIVCLLITVIHVICFSIKMCRENQNKMKNDNRIFMCPVRTITKAQRVSWAPVHDIT